MRYDLWDVRVHIEYYWNKENNDVVILYKKQILIITSSKAMKEDKYLN